MTAISAVPPPRNEERPLPPRTSSRRTVGPREGEGVRDGSADAAPLALDSGRVEPGACLLPGVRAADREEPPSGDVVRERLRPPEGRLPR